jgi:hypothetical protein
VRIFFSLVVFFTVPCLYSQTGLFFQSPPPASEFSRDPEFFHDSRLFRDSELPREFRPSRNSEMSPNAGFDGLFLVPDFGKPRIVPLADTGAGGTGSPEKPASSIPLWLKDLRRAEIVAFGSFPLMLFWTSFFMDLHRSASHGWDNRYAPWPFKGTGAVAMTDREISTMFTIVISGSLTIAVLDHLILRYRRSKTRDDSAKPVRLEKTPPVILED